LADVWDEERPFDMSTEDDVNEHKRKRQTGKILRLVKIIYLKIIINKQK
jgi:hypothetical protein